MKKQASSVLSKQLTHNKNYFTDGCVSMLVGSVGCVSLEHIINVIKCRRYLVSFFQEDHSRAVIVVELLEESQGVV